MLNPLQIVALKYVDLLTTKLIIITTSKLLYQTNKESTIGCVLSPINIDHIVEASMCLHCLNGAGKSPTKELNVLHIPTFLHELLVLLNRSKNMTLESLRCRQWCFQRESKLVFEMKKEGCSKLFKILIS